MKLSMSTVFPTLLHPTSSVLYFFEVLPTSLFTNTLFNVQINPFSKEIKTESCHRSSQRFLTQASNKLFSGPGNRSYGRIQNHINLVHERQRSQIGLHLSLGLVAVSPYTSSITTPSFSFLSCKMGTKLPVSQDGLLNSTVTVWLIPDV